MDYGLMIVVFRPEVAGNGQGGAVNKQRESAHLKIFFSLAGIRTRILARGQALKHPPNSRLGLG